MNLNFKITKLNKYRCYNFISFMIVWILYGFNTYNTDYTTYEFIYNSILYTGNYIDRNIEFGFRLIMKFFAYFNFNYQTFLIFYSFISLIVFYRGVKKFTKRPYIVLFLFLIYPLYQYILAIRLFLALGIVINAITYLKEKSITNIIKFIALILLSSLIHQTSIFYILLLLLVYFNKQQLLIISSLIITVLCSVLFVPEFQKIISIFFPKFILYIQDGTNILTLPVVTIYYILVLILFRVCKYRINDINFLSQYEFINKIFIILITALPLVYLSMDFFRLITNMTVFIYLVISNCKFIYENKIGLNSLYVLSFIIIQDYIFEFMYSFESQVLPILTNNLFW